MLNDEGVPVDIPIVVSDEEKVFRQGLQTQGVLLDDISITNQPDRISYFDIVDTELIRKYTTARVSKTDAEFNQFVETQSKTTTLTNLGFRENVFNALLQARQFE